jgi:putative transposase
VDSCYTATLVVIILYRNGIILARVSAPLFHISVPIFFIVISVAAVEGCSSYRKSYQMLVILNKMHVKENSYNLLKSPNCAIARTHPHFLFYFGLTTTTVPVTANGSRVPPILKTPHVTCHPPLRQHNAMSPVPPPVNSSACVSQLFETGTRAQGSKRSAQSAGIGGTTSTPSCKMPRLLRTTTAMTSSIVECPLPSSVTTSQGKFNICVNDFLGTGSSPMSVPASISKGKACAPFWKQERKENYDKLWWPTATDSVGLRLTSLSGCSGEGARKCWFSVAATRRCSKSSQKTSSPSCTCSVVGSTACDATNVPSKKSSKATAKTPFQRKKPVTGAMVQRTVRMLPTATQTKYLNTWMHASRWAYNQAVFMISRRRLTNLARKRNRKRCKRNWTFVGLRNAVAALRKRVGFAWLEGVPVKVVAGAVKQACDAFASNFAKSAKNNGRHHFCVKYRRKKDGLVSMHAEKTALRIWRTECALYAKNMGGDKIKLAEVVPAIVPDGASDFDVRVSRTKLGHYNLHLLAEVRRENQAPQSREGVVALDPGVRTFQTAYSPDGLVAHLCTGRSTARLARLKHLTHNLKKRLSGVRGAVHVRKRKQYRMRRALERARQRIKDLVKDMHCKVAHFLCERFSVILLPAFATQQMSTRKGGKRKIGAATVSLMNTLSHYKFQQRLIQKAQQYTDCRVIICSEAYTTKTCGRCGVINNKVGGAKVFACQECGARQDRDVNGARNILLRNLHSVQLVQPC